MSGVVTRVTTTVAVVVIRGITPAITLLIHKTSPNRTIPPISRTIPMAGTPSALLPCKESYPFQAKLNNTSVYCLNSKVHPGMMAVKDEKEVSKQL